MCFQTQIEAFAVLERLRSTLSTLHQLQDLLQYNLRLSVEQFQQVGPWLNTAFSQALVKHALVRPWLNTPFSRALVKHALQPGPG